jgi:hypothetical protein
LPVIDGGDVMGDMKFPFDGPGTELADVLSGRKQCWSGNLANPEFSRLTAQN